MGFWLSAIRAYPVRRPYIVIKGREMSNHSAPSLQYLHSTELMLVSLYHVCVSVLCTYSAGRWIQHNKSKLLHPSSFKLPLGRPGPFPLVLNSFLARNLLHMGGFFMQNFVDGKIKICTRTTTDALQLELRSSKFSFALFVKWPPPSPLEERLVSSWEL